METFTDDRDGETYKIVRIGSLYWFAENLRYQGVPHYFPDRNSDNIHKYGCLYTWENAIKACPKGWRLPTNTDFNNLLNYIENNKISSSTRLLLSLIAKSADWKIYDNIGSDEFGFSALPAGYRYGGDFEYFGDAAYFWSSTPNGSKFANGLAIEYNYARTGRYYVVRSFSARYVKEIQNE